MLFYRVIVYYSTSVLLLLQHVNISSVGSIKSNLITANLIYRTDEIVPALYNLWIFANIIYEDTKYLRNLVSSVPCFVDVQRRQLRALGSSVHLFIVLMGSVLITSYSLRFCSRYAFNGGLLKRQNLRVDDHNKTD